MSVSTRKHVFVSYASRDDDSSRGGTLVPRVFEHLAGMKHTLEGRLTLELFIDQHRVAAGDAWRPEIVKALEDAHLAVLLLSPSFLRSDFIMQHELPRLRQRASDEQVRLVPVLLRPCVYESLEWLHETEIRPRGTGGEAPHALSEIEARGAAHLDRALEQIVREISRLLVGARAESTIADPWLAAEPRHAAAGSSRPPQAPGPRGAPVQSGRVAPPATAGFAPAAGAQPPEAPVHVLEATLFAALAGTQANALARGLVSAVMRLTGLADEQLFRAIRFCIEHQLLVADDPASPATLQGLLDAPIEEEGARRLLAQLSERTRAGDFARAPIEVNSRFFSLTRERESLWKAYFDAVLEAGIDGSDRERLAALCPVRVKLGFLAPQHLVAGLLSRFDDDWRPVLNAYHRAVTANPAHPVGVFESLQASQWNCWLVWGPSIPICTCQQWRGSLAFQYGYGDENNSLPIVDLDDDSGRPGRLDPIAVGLHAQARGAKWVELTGRLRWGPWYLRDAEEDEAADAGLDDPERVDDCETGVAQLTSRRPAAAAQASLFREDGLLFRHDSDGLTLQVEAIDRVSGERRVYFSAYLWMIFLVATARETPAGPRLLRGKPYPDWPASPDRREDVRRAKLWEDLLPVFVHANIADPLALDFQKRALAHNAVAMLQQVWQRRSELFAEEDVRAGLRFHLVSASDYSGCGCPVRYPSGTPLVELIRERLVAEADAALRDAIVLPVLDAGGDARPWGLAGYFSSCHMPELVGDYFEFVNRRNDRRGGSN